MILFSKKSVQYFLHDMRDTEFSYINSATIRYNYLILMEVNLYGLQAISANNGWAIAVVGISIIFTGLVLLSFSIAQIHKILDLWENRHNIGKIKDKFFNKNKNKKTTPFTDQEKESSRQFKLLARTLDDNFSLPRLLKLAEVSGLNSPHSSLAKLLSSGIIKSDQKGLFTWDRELSMKITAS